MMNKHPRMKHLIPVGILIVIAAATIVTRLNPTPQKIEGRLDGYTQPVSGFERAAPGRSFSFPLDHGPHTTFQTEWWYFTGNVETANGRRFGYQLTFFRRGLIPPSEHIERLSAWASDQVYMAHLTISDIQQKQFHYAERFERGAAGLAGASGENGLTVWLEDWEVNQIAPGVYRLDARLNDQSLSLTLTETKKPVLQGDQGYSRKGDEPGNASYYYSLPRLESRGTITAADETYSVTGLSWMDHEFSTSALAPAQTGWDWVSIQLDDGSELMLYTIRRTDGSSDPYSSGTIIYPNGSTRHLKNTDFSIAVTKTWHSPHSQANYPAGWTIDIPSEELSLQVTPLLPDQELNVSFIYWEGAVEVSGKRAGRALDGEGYFELTGYAQSMQDQF